MRKKNRIRLLFGVCLTLAVTLVLVSFLRSPSRKTLRLAVGSPAGTYYSVGEGLKAAVEQYVPGMKITLIPTSGSEQNVRMLAEGEADLAFVQAGTEGDPCLRSIASLYPEVLQIVVRSDAPVASISDLRCAKIAVGAAASGTNRLTRQVLEHHGVTPRDFRPFHEDFAAAIEALKAGKIDAACFVSGIPTKAIQDLPADGTFRFLPVQQGAALSKRLPYLVPDVIPLGLYRGTPPFPSRDVPTIAVTAVLATNDQLSERTIHRVTGALFSESGEFVRRGHRCVADLDEDGAQAHLVFPLHPGAWSYYHRSEPPLSGDFSDFLALVVALLLPLAGMIWAVAQWMLHRRKDRLDKYYAQLHECLKRAQHAENEDEYAAVRHRLLAIKRAAFRALDREQVSANNAFVIFQQEFAFCYEYVNLRSEGKNPEIEPPA